MIKVLSIERLLLIINKYLLFSKKACSYLTNNSKTSISSMYFKSTPTCTFV